MTARAEPVVDGPHLVSEVPPEMGQALATLWIAVIRAGGAVGFVPDSPEDEVRTAADAAIEQVRAGREHMLVIGLDQALGGAVFLRRGPGPIVEHRADVLRLMVHPDLQRRGWGRTLLDAAVAHATALGLEQLLLSARGGTDLPAFYARQGWTEVGRIPGAIRPAPDDVRDEHLFQLRLS